MSDPKSFRGFPLTATILPVLLSEGYHKGRIGLQLICDCLTAAPARIFHIDDRKGHIRPGYDGDLTIVHLNLEREVVAAELAPTPTTASMTVGNSADGRFVVTP